MAKHIYIPIIKGKKNDLDALGKLHSDKRELIKPLIELPPTSSKKNVSEYLNTFINNLSKYAGAGSLFVDFNGLFFEETTENEVSAIVAGYDLLFNSGKQVTPVYGFGRDDEMWAHFDVILKQHNQGFCFRLEEDDIEDDIAEDTWMKVLTRSSQLNVNIKDVDLIIDLQDVRLKSVADKVALVTDFMSLKPKDIVFRSVAISGSSAPKDVSVIEKDSIGEIERKELLIWAYLRADLLDGDSFIYSDYGVVHPDWAADDLPVGGSANCKIRYTANNKFIIFRGHKRAGDSAQQHILAKNVYSHSMYCGRDYSFGDEYIDDVANYKKGPGNLGNWVLADMNHHITYTFIQIDNLRTKLVAGLSQEKINYLLEEFV